MTQAPDANPSSFSFCDPKAQFESAADYKQSLIRTVFADNTIDLTGLKLYLDNRSEDRSSGVPERGPEMARLYRFICSSLENEQAPLSKALLAATTGWDIHEALWPVLESGEWRSAQ